jgi:hypothetical protein
MKTPFRNVLLVVSMALTSAACVKSYPRTLPPPPADFGLPVPVPAIKSGDDARVVAARLARALRTANTRLSNDSAFYADVTAQFSEGY